MIFYKGFPRDQGSTDFMDSARLAGIMSVFKWPNFIIQDYSKHENPVRCPESDIPGDECSDPRNMSRDQIVPLMAGYYFQQKVERARSVLNLIRWNRWRCPNGDFLSPSQRDHLKRCGMESDTKLGRAWLRADIMFNAYITPLAEPNQLIAMMMTAGPEHLKLWVKHNSKWRQAIRDYWSEGAGAWRGEPELTKLMIETIEKLAY